MSESPPCAARKRGRAAARYEVNGTWMTVKEAADMCGVSVVSFRKRMERHGETVAGAVAHYTGRRIGLTKAEKAMVDEMADILIAMAPGSGTEENGMAESAKDEKKDLLDRETLVVFNNLIGALEELLKLEMFDIEIDRKANELRYDMDRTRWEMFGRMVDWKKIAENKER